jgi:hypothetical protein
VTRVGLVSTLVVALLVAGSSARAQEPTKQECVAANESAQDLQRASKLVEAREQLHVCAAKACPRAVRMDCADRLDAIEKALPTVVLAPKDPGGADLGSAAIAIDGAALPEALDGTPIPVDPGTHTFTVTLAGRAPVSLRFALKQGDAVRREVVLKALRPAAAGAPEPAAAEDGSASPAALAPASAAALDDSDGRARTLRLAGWSAIGVGAAGVALGSIFGIMGFTQRAPLSKGCDPSGLCTATTPPEGQAFQSHIDGVHFDAVASTISFAVGGVGLGTGAALLVLASQKHASDARPPRATASIGASIRARPWVGPGDVGVAGTFP